MVLIGRKPEVRKIADFTHLHCGVEKERTLRLNFPACRKKFNRYGFDRAKARSEENFMIKKRFTYITTIALLSLTLLSGCKNDRLEDQAAYRQIGINKMESGDYNAAVEAFDSALGQCVGKISANELDICYYKAAAQYAGGDINSAIETYNAILAYDKKEADAYYMRGCMYLQQQNTDAALADYENAVKYNPDEYELYIQIYENLSGHNMAEQGTDYLNRAFSIKGNSAEDLMYRGRMYYLLGQYDNALTELKSAVEKENPEACLYLAQTYEAQGDSQSAAEYYQKYVETGATDSQAMNALAQIQMQNGNYAEALDYLQQGIAMDQVTNQRQLLQNLVIAYEYTGDFDSAWNTIQKYVELYPEDEKAQREYIFLKNRVDPNAIQGEVIPDTAVEETPGTEVSGTE